MRLTALYCAAYLFVNVLYVADGFSVSLIATSATTRTERTFPFQSIRRCPSHHHKGLDFLTSVSTHMQRQVNANSLYLYPSRTKTKLQAIPDNCEALFSVQAESDASTVTILSDWMLTQSSSSSWLSHSTEINEEAILTGTGIPLIDAVLSNPSFWAISVMLSIVGLLLTWEESIHAIRKTVPKPLSPVIDSMLGEIGGLGFIGLFLDIFVTRYPSRGVGGIIGDLSERFLGEKEILLEAFESLHASFFEVGVAFFVVTGIIVGGVLGRINELSNISKLALDTDGDGEVSLEELADALNVPAVVVDTDGDGELSNEEISDALRKTKYSTSFLGEITMPLEKRVSEILLIRERLLIDTSHSHLLIDDNFRVEKYFEQIFGHNLEEMVELSPLTWLPLIPLISVLDAVDLSREIVSASSQNAALSAGCFATSPWFLVTSTMSSFFCLGWGVFNFWKMKEIKNMLLPTLVRDPMGSEVGGGSAILLPPRYKEQSLRSSFNSSPWPIASIEYALGGEPATNSHEELFGSSGAAGPEFYRNSIKFHTWLCVASIIFFAGQIVLRDLFVILDYNRDILKAEDIGNLDWVMPELGLYLLFVLLLGSQMILAPTVFLNYCTATSIEEMTQGWAIKKAQKACKEEADDCDDED